jgi:hypothetical protein
MQGLKEDNGDDIFNINQAPFSSLKRDDIKPTADMLKQDIERRHQLAIPGPSATQRPKPKHLRTETLRNWLADNPIRQTTPSMLKQMLLL